MIYTLDAKGSPIQETEFNEKTVLIMGNEGKGVRYQIKEESDYLISIPMTGKLDSINLSNAFAIAAWEVMKSRK
jgi:23S rRNA (guanosine2251-2'-O)-methyltransferase